MTPVPPGAEARAMAARAMHAVLHEKRSLDQGLDQAAADVSDARQRAQGRALAYEALRWHCRHRLIIRKLLTRPLRPRDRILESLLSVGIQELTGGHAPDYAAVSATVDAARLLRRPRAAGLVNATLRRFLRERSELTAAAMADTEGLHAYPAWLIDAVRRDWPDAWEALLEAGQHPPPMWLRVNLHRQTRAGCAARLADAGMQTMAPAEFPAALRLETAVDVDELPGFRDGELSVQDAGAQLAADLLAPAPGQRVLDACAAPGGKTGHLLERSLGRLDLTAIDVDPKRLDRVAENLSRLRYPARLLAADLLAPDSWWDGRLFDAILLDVPCSATGVIRRHPDIRFLRRATDVPVLAELQSRLLESAWRLLRPAGRLLYATCSVLHSENRDGVAGFLARHADAREIAPGNEVPPPARSMAPGYQLLPGSGDFDGFYYALLEKRAV